jgi:hypothetical protein
MRKLREIFAWIWRVSPLLSIFLHGSAFALFGAAIGSLIGYLAPEMESGFIAFTVLFCTIVGLIIGFFSWMAQFE